MAHAVAPNARQRHFDAAFLADDALVFHALVLAAQAFVILDRTEDARAEQTVALGLERAVIDRLRLLDLAERPGENLLRAGDRNLDLVEGLRRHDRIEEIHDLLLIHGLLLWTRSGERLTAFHARSNFCLPQRKRGPRKQARAARNIRAARDYSAPSTATGTSSPSGVAMVSSTLRRQRTHFLDQHVEAFGNADLECVVAAHDRLIDLGAAGHVVRLHGQHFLQRIGGAIGLQRPDLHFAETLSAELRLAAERLLRDQRIGADRARMDLVVDEMVQLQHIDVADRHLAVEGLAGAPVVRASPGRTTSRPALAEHLDDVLLARAVEHRRRDRHAAAQIVADFDAASARRASPAPCRRHRSRSASRAAARRSWCADRR